MRGLTTVKMEHSNMNRSRYYKHYKINLVKRAAFKKGGAK